MNISLYDVTVASYLQTLGGVVGFLDKGSSHFAEHDIDPASVVETRLIDDMLPFRFQLISVAHHSLGAIKGMQAGVFRPPPSLPELDYAGLQQHVANARDELAKLSRGEVDALAGKDMTFEIGERKVPFVTHEFALSFSLPNFYFHAATAYDVLRMKGVPLGKRDFMGKLRIKS